MNIYGYNKCVLLCNVGLHWFLACCTCAVINTLQYINKAQWFWFNHQLYLLEKGPDVYDPSKKCHFPHVPQVTCLTGSWMLELIISYNSSIVCSGQFHPMTSCVYLIWGFGTQVVTWMIRNAFILRKTLNVILWLQSGKILWTKW